MTAHPAIVWFRRDLRLADNPALAAALNNHRRIVPVYIHAPDEEAPWAPGAASRWWLQHSLTALDARLREHGSGLVIRHGRTLETLRQLIAETGANAVHWNRLYEPATIARDTEVKEALRAEGTAAHSHNAALLFEPWSLTTQSGGPYRVFTPFWKACLRQGLPEQGEALSEIPPETLLPSAAHSAALDTLGLLPTIPWDAGFNDHWQPGEAGAWNMLREFLDHAGARYAKDRDRPGQRSTSRLSPHLHFGEIGPRQIVHAVRARQAADARPGAHASLDSLLRELGWREFSHHLLYHFPHTPATALDERFARFAWRRDDADLLAAWQRGRTGIPLVDAGMRELWHTGWMHNRVRMVVASFLTKNLLLPWQDGARWFWDTLVDADLANNTQGWQWTTGCGADAAPYFRVFNPVLQSRKFDPDGVYLRRWLPELACLPDTALHAPWEAPEHVLRSARVRLGSDYPRPIVELRASRQRALDAYARIRVMPA
ncbi:cryptochrome/photolyase family protein [Acidihalobacter ferrooxydans]|uniref:Deoxyribodipyrimidine photo-lyase n=1 Tax=Acidihalobacter ferrooxydans TaxID=1765967 RepID=A0A1P8UG73_9GAMM|nr:deoxyribodipyrimidine photo-lyase [Acidihalobacter ferrooxydans]APZ42853.1 deoxyribodipyrimidine photolyase [Acidihalobacter ferrooxydans]